MKFLFVSLASLFAAFFWKQPANKTAMDNGWPSEIPVFAKGHNNFSYQTTGQSKFISFISFAPPEEVLASAKSSFIEDGWQAEVIYAKDTLIFTKKNAVAAVIAKENKQGSCVTTILRSNGL
ncbi:MAG: hypothetical protein J6V88_05730 [Kiritimatiellae bacterium]|jgi:hypothetical protein|nr:hypothetical protein [Kiritimatiellia bacterium]